jgi:hypothetical protein
MESCPYNIFNALRHTSTVSSSSKLRYSRDEASSQALLDGLVNEGKLRKPVARLPSRNDRESRLLALRGPARPGTD